MKFNRRTYLKGTVAATATLAGLGGTFTVLGKPANSTQEGQSASRVCPSGTTRLVKYESEDVDGDDQEEFIFAEGDDVVTFTNISRNQEGEIVEFSWESTAIVAVLTVKFGSESQQFEGGFEGRVDLSSEQNAISNVAFCAPRGGRAVLCELDMNMGRNAYDTELHLDGDPAGGTREGVVHVTSTGATQDYGHAMVNLLQALGKSVTLDDLSALEFDFYEGANNERAMPDELFVSLLTPTDELKLAVQHFNESSPGQSWHTFDVLSELSNQQWSVEDISLDDLGTSPSAINTAQNLRDTPDESVAPRTKYAGATLAGVGFGAGNTRSPTTLDRYFDNLVVEWNGGSATFDFPAVLPMTVDSTQEQGNSLVVTLSFQQPEAGISFDDVAKKSVTLNAFGQFAPPIEIGATAQSVNSRNDTLEAAFSASDVDAVLGNSDMFVISGDFDVRSGSSFFAVGER